MATQPLTADAAPDAAVAERAPRTGVPAGVVVLGFAGAIALTWGTWRVGTLLDRRFRLRWMDGVPVLGSLPLPSRPLGYLLWGVGLAALSSAWVLLRRQTVRPGHGIPVAAVAAVAVLWTVPLVVAPPIGSRDAYSYAAYGELAAQ